ncbi:MAG: ABC transporter ATP-binding protein [Oscillospiraceae bacterium]|jgi:simple sugar transport system ATP-binding protein|nr:ABC transporter ATP-binding protein [Oscillospiraceae bacterium]
MLNTRAPALELRLLTKAFGSLVACDHINMTLHAGEILALLGENGSGKTTLMNMIAGLYRPDSGDIFVRGIKADIHSPSDARKHGIGMIHQHFKLVDVFTARQNIQLGAGRDMSDRALNEKVRALGERFGLTARLDQKVYDMSVGQKQTVEIIKALCRGADILILDEPTAVLTPQESDRLFDILRRMKADGAAIIIITHKLGEVMALSDRVAILRGGRNVGEALTSKTNAAELTEKMVGQKVDLSIARPAMKQTPLFSMRNVSVRSADGVLRLDRVSFDIAGGEILGVAGIAGSGQKQLCECIAGLEPICGGEILFKGKNIAGQSPRQIYDIGVRLGFIPEDRLGMGLVGAMDVTDNLLLREYRLQPGFFIKRGPVRERARDLIKRLSVAPPDPSRPVGQLSGGNLQKVLLGRELLSKPELLITSYVVRGLDVHSSYVIYDLLNDCKLMGVGALFVGEDLDVLLELCDRVLVLCGGQITGLVNAKTATREQIGLMMVGQSG